MPRPLRWLAFRLGLLFSILALNLLAPLVLFYSLIPVGHREKVSGFVAAYARSRIPALSRVLSIEA